MAKPGISVIVPAYNEQDSIAELIKRLHASLTKAHFTYEIIVIDDHSSDATRTKVRRLAKLYNVTVHLKQGQKGKSYSLLEGFSKAKYSLLAMIDADLQYPPEAIAKMAKEVGTLGDIIVARRQYEDVGFMRQLASKTFSYLFGRLLHGLHCDVQSGLKVFKAEIIHRLTINPTPWTFDLSFLHDARSAGYSIASFDIPFLPRQHGESKIQLFTSSYEIALAAIAQKFRSHVIIPTDHKKNTGFHFHGTAYKPYTSLPLHQAAITRLTQWQSVAIMALVLTLIALLATAWHTTILVILTGLTTLYFADFIFNIVLIYRSYTQKPNSTTGRTKKSDSTLPRYTILCPLYKEWAILPQFTTAIDRIDYPKNKLQVLLLLEEDDAETIEKARHSRLPSYFAIVVVPHSLPKTKPKACNYGLQFATGEYTVIYDAEDIPDPQQLKTVVAAFAKSPAKIACMQAKLSYYNIKQNLLTRLFTAEYALWFELILPGLQSIGAPIPLGGTSNHFRTDTLRKLNGWDAFNVTEDCDLGIRLARFGFSTAIVDSVTLEEANSNCNNWLKQRTRWIKGYMQTYLVHMRNPRALLAENGFKNTMIFQIVVGGKILSLFTNPIMWLITIIYFVFRPIAGEFIESFFPRYVLYMAVTCLIFGNFLYVYYYMLGLAKRDSFEFLEAMYLIPLYWLAMSVAGTRAFYQLIVKPHYWSKTTHGLHLQNAKSVNLVHKTIGKELVDESIGVLPRQLSPA